MITTLIGHLCRAFPIMVPVCSFGYGVLLHQPIWCYYALVSLSVDVTVHTLKRYFFYPLYQYLGVTSLPILGRGIRPDGAKNCGWFIDCDNPKGHGYGMPSGHSASAFVFATFWSLYLLEQSGLTSRQRQVSIGILFIIAGAVAYSRYLIRCHTPQQIILGSLLGSFVGYISYQLWRSWVPDKSS